MDDIIVDDKRVTDGELLIGLEACEAQGIDCKIDTHNRECVAMQIRTILPVSLDDHVRLVLAKGVMQAANIGNRIRVRKSCLKVWFPRGTACKPGIDIVKSCTTPCKPPRRPPQLGAALLSSIAPLPTAERERCQALLDAVINDSKEHQMKSIKEHAWGLDSDDKPTGDAVIVAVRPNDDAKTHVDPREGFQWK